MLKTRTLPRSDGGMEILRILDDSVLRRWTPNDPVSYEKSIVWRQSLDGLDFVRVAFIKTAKSRRGALVLSGDLIVLGYAKLTDDAPIDPETQRYTRRIFYLKDEDSSLNMNHFPAGSIDPRTILPSVCGEPPKVEQVERGYPWYVSRAELGLSSPPVSTG
ncbi:MAG: hypothetical protein CMJ64_14775 [Planctomycetaceae bacterium]|nr:hypothetical protein [Planctomycetaceae bacterium]